MMSKKVFDAIVAGIEAAVARARGVRRRDKAGAAAVPRRGQPDAYSRSEVLALGNEFPRRGQLCHHCGLRIPDFADLRGEGRRRVLGLIRDDRRIMAIAELCALTGCSLRWAKLWVHHAGRPQARHPGPPCPFCGEPLKTSRAQLCLACGCDWHGDAELDPDHARIMVDRQARCYPHDDE
jgi:hypothetical protein